MMLFRLWKIAAQSGLALLLGFLLIGTVQASENRVWLASQMDFGAHRGFYVDFENSAPGDESCPLASLKLILGVADGSGWRFLTVTPAWQYEHVYQVRAVISPQDDQLWLDGQKVADQSGGFSAETDALTAGMMPNWAHGPADYWIIPTTLQITGGTRPLALAFARPPDAAVLRVWEPQAPQRIENWEPEKGQTLTLTATFHLTRPPASLTALEPLVDRYGQSRYGQWPGKVRSDADLQRDRAAEDAHLQAWARTMADYDRYGGWRKAGWHEAATGFFHTARHNGVWWLISPDGYPCFYTSVCTAPLLDGDRTPVTGREALFSDLPPHQGPYAAAWGTDPFQPNPAVAAVSFPTANLIRKYGVDWRQKFTTRTVQRLKAWGFTGLGKWCSDVPGVPSLPVLSDGAPNLVRHPDIFDPAVVAALTHSLSAQISPHKDDPDIVGWSLGNEYDGIITGDEITAILTMGAAVPAKKALVDHALEALYGGDVAKMAAAWHVTAGDVTALYAASPQAPAGDLEALRRFYAERFYDVVYRTVKQIDPNHLYLGFWIVPGWWVSDEDWRMIARHCDVIGYDNYSFSFADDSLVSLMAQTGKPTLCGEFSFPPQYGGARGFGLYDAAWATEDADAGRLYTRYVESAARSPYCVGVSWFEYRDEPLTGRGPGEGPGLIHGEHYAFGLVDVADQPRWAMIEQMRQANLAAARWRQQTIAHPSEN